MKTNGFKIGDHVTRKGRSDRTGVIVGIDTGGRSGRATVRLDVPVNPGHRYDNFSLENIEYVTAG